jgi:hypothetical protein
MFRRRPVAPTGKPARPPKPYKDLDNLFTTKIEKATSDQLTSLQEWQNQYNQGDTIKFSSKGTIITGTIHHVGPGYSIGILLHPDNNTKVTEFKNLCRLEKDEIHAYGVHFADQAGR